MKTEQWKKEVERVANAIGLNKEQTLELVCWSIEMAYDDLAKAQERFAPKVELEFYTQINNPYKNEHGAQAEVQCYNCGQRVKIANAYIIKNKISGEERFYHDPNCQFLGAKYWGQL